MPENGKQRRPNRRTILRSSGIGGTAIIAGCLGDDEEIDDVEDVGLDDGDDGDEIDDDEEEEHVVHDIVATNHVGGEPLPADANHFRHGEGTPPTWQHWHREGHYMGAQAFATLEMDTMLFDDWSYEPGLLEVYFPDNVFFWDGKQMEASDHTLELEFEDFLMGGDDLDAHDPIVSYSLIEDDTVRYTLVDAWREDIAIDQVFAPARMVKYNAHFLEPWLERFRDAPDLEAIEEIREEIGDIWCGPGENEEILEQTHHIPMEFRFDGSIGDIGENYWQLELVPERGGTMRKYADLINFKHLRIIYGEVEQIARQEHQVAGSELHSGLGTWGNVIPDEFEVQTQTIQRPFDEMGFQFQFDSHPSNLPGFRRAWTYIFDKTYYDRPDRQIPEIVGPFYSDDHQERFISDHILQDFTDYGHDEQRWDDAEAEMELWGFERNADGLWLMQEDGPHADAGEPMELTLNGRGWHDFVIDEATDMWADIEDWGIPIESQFDFIGSVDLDGDLDEGMTMITFYHGGSFPEMAFGSTWGRDSLSWSNPNIFAPSVIDAPEVGDTAEAGDYDPDDWRQYETRAMTDRLSVTVDEEVFQSMVDELSWVWNQLIPRFGYINSPQTYIMNTEYWRMRDMTEYPDLTLRMPHLGGRFAGPWEYIGPEEGPQDVDELDFEPEVDE